MNVLVVAAHPDDEVLGVAGTMARLSSEGHDVDVVLMGEGSTSRSNGLIDHVAKAAELTTQSRAAADVLGVRDLVHLGLPDNRFDQLDLLDVVKMLEAEIEPRQPDLVFTHSGGDVNVDHQVVFRATMAATRPVPNSPTRAVLTYEVGSSTEWAFGAFAPVFNPTVFYDISTTIEQKLAAMSLYVDECRPFPHPRSQESLRAQATRWGSTIGVAAAEAFQLIRERR